MPVTVTVCVGSSCHVRGSRSVLKRFAEVLKAERLEDDVALVGSFCLERCSEGVNWKFNDENICSATVDDAEATLRVKLLQATAEDRASAEGIA